MSKSSFSRNRPYSPDADTTEQVKHWHTPDLTADTRRQDNRTNALNMHLPESRAEQQQPNEEELVLKPLTADDIEQIRQAAYDEGISQGKEEGFAKGYTEGREQGQQDGFKQGQAEGKKQGLADASNELDTLRAELSVLLDQLQQPMAGLDSEVEQELLALTLAMAKAVINTEVKTNSNVILQALQEAIAALPLQSNNLVIKLHAEDLAIIKRHYNDDELTERGWQLRAEPMVEQGGCLVESTMSSVNRSLEQRVQSSLDHFLQLNEAAAQQNLTKAVSSESEASKPLSEPESESGSELNELSAKPTKQSAQPEQQNPPPQSKDDKPND